MNTGRLRGALIGAGSIAPYHLTAWQRIPGVEIVAIGNRTVARAAALAERFGIGADHVYGDLDALFAGEPGLDFVDIATAPDLHRPHTEAAAARGVAVLCQKPFAPSLEDAQAMIDACRRAGVLLAINENWRWRSWYRAVRALLDQGAIGRLRYVRVAAHRNVTLGLPGGELPGLLARQPYTRTMPKLIVFEWGTHLIDTLRMLLGEPGWIHARMAHVSPLVAGEDRALLTLGFGEVVASIDVSWASYAPDELPTLLEEVVIEGDGGSIALVPNQGNGDLLRVIRPLDPTLVRRDGGRTWSPLVTAATAAHDGDLAAAYQASFTAAQADFVAALRHGRLPETHAGDNVETLRATLAAYESARTNRVVTLAPDGEGRADG